jgi:trans-aconitate methyltransferase
MDDAWDPEQYQRFAPERSAPFWDLLGLVRPAAGSSTWAAAAAS